MEKARRGAYVIYGSDEFAADFVLLATGSEVELAIEVAKILQKNKLSAKVVSMWCHELFEEQDPEYIDRTLGEGIKVSIEFGATYGWSNFADYTVGVDNYGLSSKPDQLIEFLNLTPSVIAQDLLDIHKNEYQD